MAAAAAFFASSAPARNGPISELYLTSKSEGGGGKSQFDVVQGTNVVRSWSSKHGNELGLAVNDTVRSVGLLNVPAPGDIGAEYTLAGAYTGNDSPFPVNSISFLQFLDGTTDGTHNYAWDFNNNDAWQFDANWANGTNLFHVAGTATRIGITWDRSNDSLWLSGYNTNVIENRALDGTLLSAFVVPHIQNYALALDPADGTLWMLSPAAPGLLVQYSRAGQFLSSNFYPALVVKNILGGEFRLPPAPSRLTAPGVNANGSFQFVITGVTPTRTNVVQSSADLSNWTAISTNVAVSNSIVVVIPTAAGAGPRFYRTFEIH